MQLFKKLNAFSEVFTEFQRRKKCLCKSLKSHGLVHPRTVNMLKGWKHCWNLEDSSFIIFFGNSERIEVQKYVSK